MDIEIKYKKRLHAEISKDETFLDLSDLKITEISKIEGLDKLVNLNYLSLRGNQISKIAGLGNLIKKLPQLKKVYLYNNPLNEKSIEEIKQIQQKYPEIQIKFGD